MNDRFKFRVWDKLDEEYYDENCFQMQIESSGDLFIIGVGNDGEDCFWETGNTVVEQCTGLKDKNGKLIYEGDILDFDLSTPRNGGHYRGFIRWQERNDLVGWVISDMDMAGEWDLRQIAHPNDWMVWGEIIGNIHENADLLENKECYSD